MIGHANVRLKLRTEDASSTVNELQRHRYNIRSPVPGASTCTCTGTSTVVGYLDTRLSTVALERTVQ